MPNNLTFFLLLLGTLTLSGCGQMGPLYLPSEEPPVPSASTEQRPSPEATPDASAEQPDPRNRPDT